jgi:diguanylate cyclase (GGDEF)-like protein
MTRRQDGLADPKNMTHGVTPAPAMGAGASSHGKLARLREEVVRARKDSLRENDLVTREDEVHVREDAALGRESKASLREDAAQGRETEASLREESAASREQEIHVAGIYSAEQQDHNIKLRRANEQLVIASLQLQIASEEIEKSKVEMAHLAHHDFLTDLPNRMQLYDRIAQAIASAKRHHEKLAVLFLDLDRFKSVNDNLGHAIGDKLLQSVAQRLKSAIRSTDTVSRQGGDEFVLLLSEVNEEEALALKIEKIHQTVTAPYRLAGNDLHIGATIGISIFPQDGEDTETLVRNADAAMYHGKENGRNRYQFFKWEMHVRDVERQEVEASLRQALDRQQFVLFYQAQITLESGAVTGAEALIRWRHPSRGLLLPAWFVPVAEDSGAIVPIGRWVLREACRQAQSWLEAGLAFNVMAVNISAREFENDDFLENVRRALQETGLAPDHLELELTETVLMKSIESTAATLHALRAMGVRISIDDFGTGYSSLSYLKRFPVDTLKIDKSFVHDILTEDDDILVNAVIGIGKSLRHQVIAEGVETAKQLAYLRENDCAAAQGFYLNVPMIAEEFAAFLKQGVPANVLN